MQEYASAVAHQNMYGVDGTSGTEAISARFNEITTSYEHSISDI
jgi:hypothetical protein